MNYAIEIIDAWGRRRAWFDQVPLLEAERGNPDQPTTIRGLLPRALGEIGPGCRLRVYAEGQLFAEAPVRATAPEWGQRSKLILDKLVPQREVLTVDAASDPSRINTRVRRTYHHHAVDAIVRDLVQAAPGPLHCAVAHDAYPLGATREYLKFIARKGPENELFAASIAEGDWAGGARVDASAAYAKDGDTIAGLKVDGVAWPDLRLMMVDCEETSRNSHAFKRHPETEFWTSDEYNRSPYKLRADAAKAHLQALIDTHGIDYLELNPHRGPSGAFDDRVDAYGRYIGLVYGGTRCFNADLVEAGHADVYLYEDGAYHVPEMALKDYFSYRAPAWESTQSASATLESFDARGGVLELVAALAYAAGGYTFRVDARDTLHFERADQPHHVLHYDATRMDLRLGRSDEGLCNVLYVAGNPLQGGLERTRTRGESIDEYGMAARRLEYFALHTAADLQRLGDGLLHDLAYPAVMGELRISGGMPGVEPGHLLELRGAPLRRVERELPGEFDGLFTGALVVRAAAVSHRFAGHQAETRIRLGPPLRSVSDPLAYLIRSQPGASALFEFRLDDSGVALDLGYHLD